MTCWAVSDTAKAVAHERSTARCVAKSAVINLTFTAKAFASRGGRVCTFRAGANTVLLKTELRRRTNRGQQTGTSGEVVASSTVNTIAAVDACHAIAWATHAKISDCECSSGANGVALTEGKYLTDLAWNSSVGLRNASRVVCIGSESDGANINTEVVDEESSAATHSCANVSNKGLSFRAATTSHASAVAEDKSESALRAD